MRNFDKSKELNNLAKKLADTHCNNGKIKEKIKKENKLRC